MTTIEAAEIGRVGGVIGKIHDRNRNSKKPPPFPEIEDEDDSDESSPDPDTSSTSRPTSSTQNRNSHHPTDDDAEHRIDVIVSGIILPTLQILPTETRNRTLH